MTIPEMTPVSSSNIAKLGYESATQTVFVQFTNNSLYVYKNVPEGEYHRLFNASSIGSYLHRHFKNVYAYERLE